MEKRNQMDRSNRKYIHSMYRNKIQRKMKTKKEKEKNINKRRK